MTYQNLHHSIAACLVAVAAVAACTTANPHRASDAGGDAGTCQPTCAEPTPLCKADTGMCVECSPSVPDSCGGKKPICGSDFSCQPCTAHNQCASNVCLPDGSCSDGRDVAFVQQDAVGTTCVKADPCPLLSTALATMKPYVKMSGVISDNVVINNQNVVILAEPNTKLSGKADGAIVKITGSSEVSVYDLTISGATGFTYTGHGMLVRDTPTVLLENVTLSKNVGRGLTIESASVVKISSSTFSQNYSGIFAGGGVLILTRSTVSDNGSGVIGGGNLVAFQITNSFIVRNTSYGGLHVSARNPTNCEIEFNTIVDNNANKVGGFDSGGVYCNPVGIVAANNLIFNNTLGNAPAKQTSGNCDFTQSLLTAPANPGFKSATDYHLTSATLSGQGAIRDAVDCSGIVDFDGEKRPKNGKCDLGADEY